VGSKNYVLVGDVEISPQTGQVRGLSGPIKSIGSLCYLNHIAANRIIQLSIMACYEMDHAILNNSMICEAAFRHNSLTSCSYCKNVTSSIN